MNKTLARIVTIQGLIIVILTLIMVIQFLSVLFLSQESQTMFISCPEDSVIVGEGDYDRGQWSNYLCIPLDDITEGVYND